MQIQTLYSDFNRVAVDSVSVVYGIKFSNALHDWLSACNHFLRYDCLDCCCLWYYVPLYHDITVSWLILPYYISLNLTKHYRAADGGQPAVIRVFGPRSGI
jgi:hypothetical protein